MLEFGINTYIFSGDRIKKSFKIVNTVKLKLNEFIGI